MTYDYDLFIIGAGSGGVRAARIAAGHGAKVAIAEEYRVGGTCVIRGCVPKKMLVYGAHFAEDLHEAARFGWDIKGAQFDWQRLRDIVQDDVTRLEGLYGQTLANNHVDVHAERAVLSGTNEVTLASGKQISAKYILIATGGWPANAECDGWEHAITSNEIFHLDQVPDRIIIVGGGYIANEFAGILYAFGSDVTIANRSDTILRSYDQEIVGKLIEMGEAKGIRYRMNAPLEKIEKNADGSLTVYFADGGEPQQADVIMVATGRVPNTAGLGLEAVGVSLDSVGAVIVGDDNRSSVDSIYAVGDVTNRVQLTPVAIREGHAFADTVFGGNPRTISYDNIPSAVFSSPPIAAVGLTEREARQQYDDVQVYRSDFRPMKNVLSGRQERGLYKMVTAGSDEKIVGLHLIGPDSSEILQAAAVAVVAGLTKQAFDDTTALHPSMAEELVLLK
ncbi:glutathione-disulfide reductase [Sphingorhabdus arenilitoris]|uniref:Glutathione-disulfide reductase n=1 Tax=Sphingorhabdus arenilitoris TaxID=1490041 RepID=A0ABV8RGQ9_9SPHN